MLVQLALRETSYAGALRRALMGEQTFGDWEVRPVNAPDPKQSGVIVVDSETLGRLPLPLPHPERVVLIAHNDPQELCRAWNAGLVSVVRENEPLSTAMLAILSAGCRASLRTL